MSNFQVDWFSTFWYTWTFIFQHFGLKLSILGQNLTFWGVNRGQMLKLNILTPKRHILAWFRALWAIICQNLSKGLISARASEKVTRKCYFNYLPRSLPWIDFYQIWLVVSTCGRNQLRQILGQSVQGFTFYREQSFHFPIGNWRHRYNSARLPCSPW